jgi:drug/metabolite transporter (DMT)-like permease
MSIPAISWWSIAYLVIIGSILSFIAYIHAKSSAEINSIYAYINPIVAVLLGALILEKLTMVIAIGGGITIFLVCIW